MSDESQIIKRKSEHLRIVTEGEAAHARGSLLDGIELIHNALPERALSEVDLSCEFFGIALKAPLMITSMTGGAEHAAALNSELASIAAELGIAFSVGSQKVVLEHPETIGDFQVRRHIPNGVLLGNIGATLIAEHGVEAIAALMQRIEADGMCVHLNAAQELAQPEGDRDFRMVLENIAALSSRLDGRLLVKETGAGLSPAACLALEAAGVHWLDVSGSGGTSWTKVEMQRSPAGRGRMVGEALADWGIPTAACVIAAREVLKPETRIIASGGIETGLDCARAIAAGADIAGFARSVLLAWFAGGRSGALEYVSGLIESLRAVMLLSGAASLAELRLLPRVYSAELSAWLAALRPPAAGGKP